MKRILYILFLGLIIFSCKERKARVVEKPINTPKQTKTILESNIFSKNLVQKGYFFDENALKEPSKFNNVKHLKKVFNDSIKFDDFVDFKEGVILDKANKKIASVYKFTFVSKLETESWYNRIKNSNPIVQFSKPKKVLILTNNNSNIIVEGYRISRKELVSISKDVIGIVSYYPKR